MAAEIAVALGGGSHECKQGQTKDQSDHRRGPWSSASTPTTLHAVSRDDHDSINVHHIPFSSILPPIYSECSLLSPAIVQHALIQLRVSSAEQSTRLLPRSFTIDEVRQLL